MAPNLRVICFCCYKVFQWCPITVTGSKYMRSMVRNLNRPEILNRQTNKHMDRWTLPNLLSSCFSINTDMRSITKLKFKPEWGHCLHLLLTHHSSDIRILWYPLAQVMKSASECCICFLQKLSSLTKGPLCKMILWIRRVGSWISKASFSAVFCKDRVKDFHVIIMLLISWKWNHWMKQIAAYHPSGQDRSSFQHTH